MKTLIVELNKLIEDADKINIIKVSKNPILLGKAHSISFEKNGIIIL